MKKRILSLLLSAAIFVSMIPWQTIARAATLYCGENLTYTESFDNNSSWWTVTISGTGAMYNYSVEDPGFYLASGISPFVESVGEVIIEEGATTIGQGAFCYRTSLRCVTIPTSVTSIEYGAFYTCTALTDVYYGGSEEDWAKITIGTRNTDLTGATIHYNSGETEAPETSEPTVETEVPETSEPTESPATNQCGENAYWTLDASTGILTISGTGDMYDYTKDEPAPWSVDSILGIVIGEGITSVGERAFYEAKNVKDVMLPDSITDIGKSAFYGCTALTEINFPEGLTSIGGSAFQNCEKLGNVVLPESLTNLEMAAFLNCKSFTEIAIPGGLTEIGFYTLSGCDNLVSVVVPDNITRIDEYAFYSCDNLMSVTLPDSLTHIGNSAFAYCKSLESIEIPGLITALYFATFRGCTSLARIAIPKSVTEIEMQAFENCTGLKNVYYAGSEADWANITINGYGNTCLTGALLHTNSSMPEIEEYHPVRYLTSWDDAEQKFYFGPDDDTGCLVTGETDASIGDIVDNIHLWVNDYVLVETKVVDGQEVLLTLAGVPTSTGIVTAVTDTQITIDERTFDVPENLTVRASYVDRTVRYHNYGDTLVDLEVLQKKTGYLTYWHSEGRTMSIQSSKAASDSKVYWLVNPVFTGVGQYEKLMDSETFLSLAADANGRTGVTVDYLVDSNRQVFEILPYVEYRDKGFSAEENGWPFMNHWDYFGYEVGYAAEPWIYYTHGDSLPSMVNKGDIVTPQGIVWNGECFGLALLAVAHYNKQIDLSLYFDRDGENLNEFGYDSVDQVDSAQWCALYHYEDGEKEHHPITTKIAQAQWSQYASELTKAEKFYFASEFQELLDRLNEDKLRPLLINLPDHTVVTDTTMKPINIGNGRYLIPIYDCNRPCAPETLENPLGTYDRAQPMLCLDVTQGQWGIWTPEEWEYEGQTKRLGVIDVYDLGKTFFDEYYAYDSEQITVIYGALNKVLEIYSLDSSTGKRTKVFEIVDGVPTFYADEGKYLPYLESDADNAEMLKGAVQLPLGTYLIKTEGETYLQCMYDNDIFVVGADKGTEVLLDTEGDALTVTGTQEETAISVIHASSEVDVCTGVESAVGTGTNVTLSTDSEAKSAEVATNADPDSVTMLHAVDGELIDITPDMIHSHGNLTYVEAKEPQCEIPGNVAHYLCGCGKAFADAGASELLTTVRVPALEHVWETVDAITKTCTLCGVTVKGYRVALDPAIAGDATSAWVDGVEYPITRDGDQYYVDIEGTTATNLVIYTYNDPNAEDVHTQYPVGMKVWMLTFEDGAYTATYVPEFDDLLQYSGSSIRIVGVKGIRMITSITKSNKQALTGKGLAGYTLVEYGTALAWASDVENGNGLLLGEEYTKSNYAYRKGVADPVFKTTNTLMQYTNVLVGFSDDQCIPDIAMRPYIILEDAEGNQVTIYGGVIYRSVGYIAYQNRNAFKPGTNAYEYVWGIIHHVYGEQFDADYKG